MAARCQEVSSWLWQSLHMAESVISGLSKCMCLLRKLCPVIISPTYQRPPFVLARRLEEILWSGDGNHNFVCLQGSDSVHLSFQARTTDSLTNLLKKPCIRGIHGSGPQTSRRAPVLASRSAASLPVIPQCAITHCSFRGRCLAILWRLIRQLSSRADVIGVFWRALMAAWLSQKIETAESLKGLKGWVGCNILRLWRRD